MRHWGIPVCVLYVLILLFVLDPAMMLLIGAEGFGLGPLLGPLFDPATDNDELWVLWVWALLLVVAQALFLFVSVDTSFRRLRPRRHIAVSVAASAIAVGLLVFFGAMSIAVGFDGDDAIDSGNTGYAVVILLAIWLAWWIWFYMYRHGTSDKLAHMTRWMIRGSILELLIAVPCHVLVRSRGDCSAPIVTGYGITTGIAVMLIAFGPAVLLLYRKRLDEYKRPGTTA